MGPIVQVIAGLYYTIAGIYVFKKLVGASDTDVVIPMSGGGRPTKDGDTGTGLLGFSSGLYGPTLIPDSGIFKSSPDAWTLKMPWEVHLKRKVPTDPTIYDPTNPMWKERAQAHERRLRERLGPGVVITVMPPSPPPKTVQFELRGEFWDENWTDKKVIDFAFEFLGTEDFSEVTLGHMQMLNFQPGQPGTIDPVILGADPATLKKHDPEERPIFFHKVFNPYAGVTSDWEFTFRNVHIVPIKNTDEKRLRSWFDWEDPASVALKLDDPPTPGMQELNYEWL